MNIATGSAKSLLLLDEHSLSRHGAAAALSQANSGWDVVTASRVPEFLRYTGIGVWDLLLVDLPTLGVDAEDLLQVFRRSCSDSRTIVLNGPEDDAIRARVTAAGADGYLSKSAAPEELCALAASLLAIPKPEPAARLSHTRSGRRTVPAGPVDPQDPDLPALLTDRQVVVLSLVAEGRSTKEIARRLGLAVGTVKAHLSGTYRALGAHSRVEALAKAGMIELSSGELV